MENVDTSTNAQNATQPSPNFHSANQHKLALPQRNPCNKYYYGMTSKFEIMLCQLFFLPVTITLMLEMRTILSHLHCNNFSSSCTETIHTGVLPCGSSSIEKDREQS